MSRQCVVLPPFTVTLDVYSRKRALHTYQHTVGDNETVSEHINLKVASQNGHVVYFKIKKNTPLRKLMGAYCERAGLKSANVRFRFDGQPMSETDTPSQLGMEEGDSIDVFQQQTGGEL